MKKQILIVDDDSAVLTSCRNILTDEGYDVEVATDGAKGLDLLKEKPFDLMLIDLKMPGMSGLETLVAAKRVDPEIVAIIFTAYGTIETAVDAIKGGAFNYLTKPFKASALTVAVEKGLEHADLRKENTRLREDVVSRYRFEKIVSTSRSMGTILTTLAKVAASDVNVVIGGESGTGKELAARSIHANSKRAAGVFVPVDCAAIPENLLESELFGYERGAFTGAERRKRGLLEQADGGTLLFDEIGELSLSLQARLLRTLQERSFRRLGGDRLISVSIRIISSTNRNLEAEVQKGNFRDDLLFRLNVVTVRMPPLRERQGDVSLLCKHFLQKQRKHDGGQVIRVSPKAMKLLERYDWPGNVRELENVVKRAVVFNESGIIEPSDLPEDLARAVELQSQLGRAESYKDLSATWARAHGKTYFEDLLRRHKGNVSSASREARISRKSFYQLLKKFDLDPKSITEA